MTTNRKKSLLNHPKFEGSESGEKLKLADHFVQSYLAAREGLKQLGMLRSERNLQGDFAEWIVAQFLGLELSTTAVQKGYDAMDSNGNTYQIKSRIVRGRHSSCSFDFRSIDTQFDYLIGVFFGASLEVLGIIQVPFDTVVELGSQTSTTFRFRWNKTISKDPRIERLFWPK